MVIHNCPFAPNGQKDLREGENARQAKADGLSEAFLTGLTAQVGEPNSKMLELNLLQAEVERLRSRRQLAEGRLESDLIQLKTYAGIPFEETLNRGFIFYYLKSI